MGDLIALYGFRWIAVITLVFSDEEYDTPDLQIGPFRSLADLKSWKRKFTALLHPICRKMPNIKKHAISFEEVKAYQPAKDKVVPPEDPLFFSRDFLKLALRDWIIYNPRNYPRRKVKRKSS